MEIYLHILKYAQGNSTFTTPDDLTFPPGSKPQKSVKSFSWVSFDTWVVHLQNHGRFWKALTVLKILGPPQVIEWGSRHYSQLIEAIEATRAREDAELCRFATSVSYSRLLSSKGRENDGLSLANKATNLLSYYQKLVQRPTPRQTLELELALLEAGESIMDPLTKLKKWTELASLAESSQEHGI